MRHASQRLSIAGRPGNWPFSGYFHGQVDDPDTDNCVVWCGRITAGIDLQMAFRAARAIDKALHRGGAVSADRRRALSIMWARLDGVPRELLGPNRGDGLVLLMCSRDAEGLAVSAVGLQTIYSASEQYTAARWISEPHPMLSLTGLPAQRPGALTMDEMPPWLIGVAHGDDTELTGSPLSAVLEQCGVWQ